MILLNQERKLWEMTVTLARIAEEIEEVLDVPGPTHGLRLSGVLFDLITCPSTD